MVDTRHGVVRLHVDQRSYPASRHVAAATPVGHRLIISNEGDQRGVESLRERRKFQGAFGRVFQLQFRISKKDRLKAVSRVKQS